MGSCHEHSDEVDTVVLEFDGAADRFEKSQGVLERLEQDAIYGKMWDHLIDMQRAGIVHEDVSPDVTQDDRDVMLSAMMNHTALEKRMLGKAFFDAARRALEAHNNSDSKVTASFRRYCLVSGITYIFCFIGGSWEQRIEFRRCFLYYASIGARVNFPDNHTVIGIAAEIDMLEKRTCGYDWSYLEEPDDEKLQEILDDQVTKDMLRDLGILADPTMQVSQVNEYPGQKNPISSGPLYKGRIEMLGKHAKH